MTMMRRNLAREAGLAAGTTAIYHAMTPLGQARECTYQGRISWQRQPKRPADISGA